MWSQCSRLKTTFFSTLVIFYIVMSLAIYKKSNDSEEVVVTKPPGDMKSLVGYSMEYQVAQEMKDFSACQGVHKGREETNMSSGSVTLVYDSNINVYVLSAYLDKRLKSYNYVRVVALAPFNSTLYCEIERNNSVESGPIPVRRATIRQVWSKSWDLNQHFTYVPVLISCLDPQADIEVPTKISFYTASCQEPKIVTSIKYNNIKGKSSPSKLRFTVCVKPLNLTQDVTKSLKEWILLNSFLGAHKIIIYYSKLGLHNLSFLKNLNDTKLVELIKFNAHDTLIDSNFPEEEKIWIKRKLEILAYNDCFYRYHEQTDYIIPLDIDEIIVPKVSNSFQGLLEYYLKFVNKNNKSAEFETFSSLSVKNAYFFRNYPESALRKANVTLPLNETLVNNSNSDLSIFRRKLRSAKYSPRADSTKSLIYVPNTLTIFNHFSFHVLKPTLRQKILPTNFAQLNHYRDYCDFKLIENCVRYLNYIVYDDSLDRFWASIEGA